MLKVLFPVPECIALPDIARGVARCSKELQLPGNNKQLAWDFPKKAAEYLHCRLWLVTGLEKIWALIGVG